MKKALFAVIVLSLVIMPTYLIKTGKFVPRLPVDYDQALTSRNTVHCVMKNDNKSFKSELFIQGEKSKTVSYDRNYKPSRYQLDDSAYTYIWSPDGANATKFPSPPKSNNVPDEVIKNSNQRVTKDGEDITCTTILTSASIFQPPANISFQEISSN